MTAPFRRAGALFCRFFFPDARTALQRREIMVSCFVVVVMAAMWAAASESGRLTDVPPFGWK